MIPWANPWYAQVANSLKICPSLTKSGFQDAYSCRQKERWSTLLHTFVDATQDAYGAVVYYRNAYQSELTSSGIAA